MTGRSAGRADRSVGRDRNRVAVFGAIVTKGPIARSEIAERTGLSQGTVTKLVTPLIETGYVVEDGKGAGGHGRPRVPLRLAADRRFALGVKATPREAVGVVADLSGRVVAQGRVALDSSTARGVVAGVASVVRQLLDEDAAFRTRTFDVGVALGAPVDAARRSVRPSAMYGWGHAGLADLIGERTGLRTVIENDVNALAVAEQWFGAGVDVPWFAVVTLGAGVGSALVMDGRLMRGARGGAGELGHLVVDPGGRPCRCGNRGCVETLAADAAVLASIAENGGPGGLDIRAAATLARSGDRAAVAAFSRAGEAMGAGIAALVNLADPRRVVLSGEGVAGLDLFADALRATLADRVLLPADEVDLVVRPLPDEAWARGAAAVALQEIFTGPVAGA
ncbi:ROK family protein [Streptomyces sp. NPDC090127]|uniref:ROK family transcriptional regulator n=1 Tax=Streptomyces sp. NPDC090127 TaxID=3365953 RepID=UPI00381ABD81